MSTPLFGSNIAPACKYCEKAIRVLLEQDQVLCDKYGIVSANHSCRHFAYDPLKRVPKRPLAVPVYTEDDFQL